MSVKTRLGLCLAVSVVVVSCTGSQASPPTTSGPPSMTVEPADASPSSSVPNDTSPSTVGEDEPDGWRELAEWPLERRSDFPQVWTGDELVIWGGLQEDTPNTFQDGARYNLATDTWMVLSDSPLSPRSGHVGVWTGTEVIYWGGIKGDGDEPETIVPIADGAAYDPESDSWQLLPDGPLDGGNPYAAAWTGSEVIYVGPDPSEVASYDPVADTWTELTPRPPRDRPTFWITAHWTGSELVVVASDDQRVDTVTYDPESDSWRELPRPFDDIQMPVTRGSPTHIWDGSTLWLLTFVPQETGVAGLDLDAGQWIISPEFPGRDCTDIPAGMSIGLGLLVDSCGTTAVLSDGQWSTIPSIPRFSPKHPGPPSVWTGEEILIFDAGIAPGSANFPDGSSPQFWLLEP